MLNEKMGAITPSKLDTSLGIEIAYVCVAQGGACALEPVNANTQEAAAYLLNARDNLVEREHLLYLSSEAQKLGSADVTLTYLTKCSDLRPKVKLTVDVLPLCQEPLQPPDLLVSFEPKDQQRRHQQYGDKPERIRERAADQDSLGFALDAPMISIVTGPVSDVA